MKKTHFKTIFYIFPILIIFMMGVSCLGPMDLNPFFNDPKVQDLIGGGGIKIDFDPPDDNSPILEWARAPYSSYTPITKGGTINMTMGENVRVRIRNSTDYTSHSWLLNNITLPISTLFYLDIEAWINPFDIDPPAVYHISLVTNRGGIAYSTYFILRIN